MRGFAGRLTTREVRLRTSAVVAVAALLAGMAAVALRTDGFMATQVDLNDAGVFVVKQNTGMIGRVNTELAQIDLRVAPGSDGGSTHTERPLDVEQDGSTVVARDTVTGAAWSVDVRIGATGDQTELGRDSDIGLGGGRAFLRLGTKLWAGLVDQVLHHKATDEADEAVPDGGEVAIGVEGSVHVWDPGASEIRSLRADGTTDSYPVPSGVAGAQLSAVGSLPVLLDTAGKRVVVPGADPVDVSGLGDVVQLQWPGAASDRVLVAGASQLVDVPLKGGAVTTIDATAPEGTPSPVRPMFNRGCSYGGWTSLASVKVCPGRDTITDPGPPNHVQSKDVRFRTNRGRVVLNDPTDGRVVIFGDAETKQMDPEEWNRKGNDDAEQDKENRTDKADESDTNHPPVAEDDRYGMRAGKPVLMRPLLNDTDEDGDPLVVSELVAEPSPDQGTTAIVDRGQAIQFTPAPGWAQGVDLRYRVSDGRGGVSDPKGALVHVEVHGEDTNGPPEAKTDEAEVEAGKAVTTDVLANDSDPDGDPVLVQAVEVVDPAAGTAQFQPDGRVQFTAAGGFSGIAHVTYRVGDDHGGASDGDLAVTVYPAGTKVAPVAINDVLVLRVGQTVGLNVLDNDKDANADPLRLAAIDTTDPDLDLDRNLDITWDPGGQVTVTAHAAVDLVLAYTVTDGDASVSGKLRVLAADALGTHPPVAVRDQTVARPGVPVYVDVLANDFDPDGDVLVVQSVSTQVRGMVVELVERRAVRITIPASMTAPGTVTYTISDGTAQAVGTVTVVPQAVNGVNQAPIAQADELTVRIGSIAGVAVLVNDRDPEGDTMTLASSADPLTPRITDADPDSGEVWAEGNELRFKAPDHERGSIPVTYTVVDSAGNRADGVVTVHVIAADPSRNRPPQPKPIEARVLAGQQITIRVPLTAIDPDGDAVSLLGLATGPTIGSIATTTGDSFTYLADAGPGGQDTFSYRVRDALGAEATAVVRVGVAPAPSTNSPPVAIDDTASVRPGQERRIDVLRNDSDPDGDAVTFVDGADGLTPPPPARGSVRIDGGVVVFSAPASLPDGPDGAHQVAFTYSITDGRGGLARATATVTVTDQVINLAPIARDDAMAPVPPHQPVTVDVLLNDDDPDGSKDDLTISVDPASGATVTADRKVRVEVGDTPAQFVYTITDPDGATARAAVFVPVAANAPPVALFDTAETDAGQAVLIDVLDNDDDPEGQPLSLVSSQPRKGLADIEDGKVRYSPPTGFAGDDGFTYQVTDGTNISVGSVKVTVKPVDGVSVNRAPVVTALPVTVPAGGSRTVDLAKAATDPDPGDRLTFADPTGETGGVSASLEGSTLKIEADGGARGQAPQLTVMVSDGHGHDVPLTINVTVTSSDKPLPVAVDDPATTTQGQPVTVDVLANDVVSGTAKLVGVDRPGSGEATTSGSSVVFTPSAEFFGDTSFTYTITDQPDDVERQVKGTVRVTVKGKPSAPAAPSGMASSHQVNLTWAVPSNNGAPIDHYTVESDDGHEFPSCPSNSCVLSGLDNGRVYHFRVRAHNEAGDGGWSGWSGDLKPDEKPARPAAPKATFGDKSIKVDWTAPKFEGSPITEYTVQISPAPAGGPATQKVGGTTTSLVWTGLTNGTGYTFRVKAKNDAGESDYGRESAPEIPAGTPIMSGEPSATHGDLRATVTWTRADSNGGAVTRYEIRVLENGTEKRIDTISDGTAANAPVLNLTNGATYTFQVRATNKAGTGDWGAVSGPAVPAGPPKALTGVITAAPGDATATVAYTAPDANGSPITGYRYSVNNGADNVLSADNVVRGLANGTTYTVRIRACNAEDCGPYGPTSNPVKPYGNPAAPGVSAGLNGLTMVWNWNAPSPSTLNGGDFSRYDLYLDSMANFVGSTGGTSWSRPSGYSEVHTLFVVLVTTGTGNPAERRSGAGQAAAATPPPPPPTVTVSKGGRKDVEGCTGSPCYAVDVSIANISPNYSIQCYSSLEAGAFHAYSTGAAQNSECVYGWPGRRVWVVVNGVRSNEVVW